MKVEYWEIWNEPEGASMFGGLFEEYVRLYGVAASYLKGCFPHLKIGGYGSCGFYGGVDSEFVQAAAIAAELIGLQNGPCDIACLYDARCREGIFSPLFNPLTIRPHKAYYALVAFNELRKRGTAVRVLCDGPSPGAYAAAAMPAPLREGGGGEAAGGSTSRGSLAVMLANPGAEEVPFALEIADDSMRTTAKRCRIIDDAHTWEEVPLPAALPPYSVLVVEIP